MVDSVAFTLDVVNSSEDVSVAEVLLWVAFGKGIVFVSKRVTDKVVFSVVTVDCEVDGVVSIVLNVTGETEVAGNALVVDSSVSSVVDRPVSEVDVSVNSYGMSAEVGSRISVVEAAFVWISGEAIVSDSLAAKAVVMDGVVGVVGGVGVVGVVVDFTAEEVVVVNARVVVSVAFVLPIPTTQEGVCVIIYFLVMSAVVGG